MIHLLVVPFACSLAMAGSNDRAEAVPSVVTAANFENIKMGMTEAEVLAVLGPPHHIRERAVEGGRGLVWEDRNGISVRYEDGKAVRIEGRFNKHVHSRSVNEANYKALETGMTRAEVEKVLAGYPATFGHGEGKVDDVEYAHFRLIMVQIKDGKVIGLSMESSEEKPPGTKP